MFVPIERIVQYLASFPLWGIKREHGLIRSPSCPCAMATSTTQKDQTQQKQHKKNEKNHIIAADKLALCELQQLMCWRLSLARIETTPRTKKSQLQGAQEGCKKSSSRCGNPGSPQPGSRRWQGDAHRAQQAPQSQHGFCALREEVIGPAVGTLPWCTMQTQQAIQKGWDRTTVNQRERI